MEPKYTIHINIASDEARSHNISNTIHATECQINDNGVSWQNEKKSGFIPMSMVILVLENKQ